MGGHEEEEKLWKREKGRGEKSRPRKGGTGGEEEEGKEKERRGREWRKRGAEEEQERQNTNCFERTHIIPLYISPPR